MRQGNGSLDSVDLPRILFLLPNLAEWPHFFRLAAAHTLAIRPSDSCNDSAASRKRDIRSSVLRQVCLTKCDAEYLPRERLLSLPRALQSIPGKKVAARLDFGDLL